MEITNQDVLPPRNASPEDSMKAERIYRTALSAKNYLRLETEAIERGIKPFKLTQSIMTLYVNRQLVYIKELPMELQNAIREFYAQKQTS